MEHRYHEILKEYWGYDDFRGIQYDIIQSIGSGHDTLGLMPTGGGKSITFQVPALCQEGVCIVVTPLIALMKDQVQNLKSRGIKATAIYSGLTRQEILIALENCIFGDYKFLYVSPERLSTEIFQTKLRRMKVSFVTVDEAHCISQWGYDFRPSYLRITELRTLLPHTPILALTATATTDVVQDIQDKLGFRQGKVFRMSFERKNLSYIVRNTEDKERELLHILQQVEGSAIVYVRNRKGTKEIAKHLEEEGIRATFYHAGLSNSEKDARQKAWQTDEIRVMVATNAFGMGIDKPDVRLVIHMQVPDSPEAYFQEAGRGGRDGRRAFAVLLYHPGDRTRLLRRVSEAFPEKEFMREVYEHLAYYFQMAMGDGFMVTREFNMEDFCIRFKHFPVQIHSALQLLTQAGYIEYTEEQENSSRLMFLVHRDELYLLNEGSEQAEEVIRTVLRNYGGVFADYVYIEENLIARQTGLTQQQVYETLTGLTIKRILHYIPRKRTPYITYTCKRVEADLVQFPEEIYEKRKAQLEHRIKAMIEYAESTTECRSAMLLRYFGEDTDKRCGCCDVCLDNRKNQQLQAESIRRQLVAWLSEEGPHPLHELPACGASDAQKSEVLHALLEEELIEIKENLIYLKTR